MSRLFGKAVHAAYVVPDIQAAMQEFIDQRRTGSGHTMLLRRHHYSS